MKTLEKEKVLERMYYDVEEGFGSSVRGVAMSMGEAAKALLFEGVKAGCDVVLRGRRGTSSHSHVSAKSVESRFVWQAKYFCKVFRKRVAFSVAGAALWRPPSSFCVAGTTLQTCRVECFCESHCQGCVKWCQRANSVAGVGHSESVILRGKCSIWWRSVLCGMSFSWQA